MPKIQRLSPNLINKIAAGEVIERPASVVKELAENAIDSGATRIDVTIEKGGSDLIRIADNGCGMDADDLILAITSHATSKLRSEEDLFSVATMGFRGEAMASIAEISQLTIRSRVNPAISFGDTESLPAAVSGHELTVQGGVHDVPIPCGMSPGTTMDVRNLFFNTPVRRKFLRSSTTEFGHITEAFQRLALANPAIHWTLTHNGRTIYDLPATDQWLERIAHIEGKELADALLYVEKSFGQISIQGYAARPNQNRSNPKMQYLFLNGRPIRDRSLQHALNEAYRGLLMTNRYPICFLEIRMPAEFVDVNVHPTKMEVRFQDSGTIYSQLLATLREKFLATNLSTFVHERDPSESSFQPTNQAFRNLDAPEPWRQEEVPWGTSETEAPPFQPFANSTSESGLALSPVSRSSDWGAIRESRTAGASSSGGRPDDADEMRSTQKTSQSETERFPTIMSRAIQIHRRYIVTECAEGLMVIDQHAMHERILYERLKQRMRSQSVEIQRLLIPEPIDLRPTEAAMILKYRDTLGQLGVLVEPFGGNTVLVHGLPVMLSTFRKEMPRADELIHEILDFLQNESGDWPLDKFTDHILHTLACKAAVKAGQNLSPGEISQLLDEYRDCTQADHCPHGRPSVLIWSCQELDKLYGRLGGI